MKRSDVVSSPRLAGQVTRYHPWPTLTSQTVADHTFHVLRIYGMVFGWPPANVTEAIVKHDLPEIGTGDPPFPVKSQNPELKAAYDRLEKKSMMDLGMREAVVSEEEADRCKICDLLEMYEFGLYELALGNTFAEPIIVDTLDAARSLASVIGQDDAVEQFLTLHHPEWSEYYE